MNYDAVLTEQVCLPHLHWVLLHRQQNKFLLCNCLPFLSSEECIKVASTAKFHPAPAHTLYIIEV